ncbi:hypothetical protein HNR46_000343 [Haloferula luteola]|uniref:Uncharacterized protein n=1 Tax=Haloferula luteola TaxID=595692 RepID=A0A840UWG0_9BACT|nr:hypothetical protein [Haloferula luteola]
MPNFNGIEAPPSRFRFHALDLSGWVFQELLTGVSFSSVATRKK